MKRFSSAVLSALFSLCMMPFYGCVSLRSPAGFDAYMSDRMEKADIPGMAVGVIKEGTLFIDKYYGFADKEAGRRVDAVIRRRQSGESKG